MTMNIFKRFLLSISVLLVFASCVDYLDLETGSDIPTDKLYESVDGAFAAMDGIYRALAAPGWTPSNLEQSSGLISTQIAADLMGDDMVQRELGNGWYYYHYSYKIREYYNFSSWTSYELWNMWYLVINQMNEIIAYTPDEAGKEAQRANLLGQAYAMRGFAYFNLIRWFQHTYNGNEDAPGVPVYTKVTDKNTEGKGRGTVQQVYEQINSDLDSALYFFEDAESQINKTHIDAYVTWGIKSRVALVQHNWKDAADAAKKARHKPGMKLMSVADLMSGFNSIANSEWMWGSEISSTQTTAYASFWAHMDARLPMHAETSRKLVSNWLYDMIHPLDIRLNWFVNPNSISDEEEIQNTFGPNVRYNQQKYYVKNPSSLTGDYLYMRAAEMYLNEAEALCRLEQYGDARNLLLELIGPRNEYYSELLALIPDGKVQTLLSTESRSKQTLLDEILIQRRIELWGEGFRMFDIIRLESGFSRQYPNTNHSYPLKLKPNSKNFVLLIPSKEFITNPAMNEAEDQNQL